MRYLVYIFSAFLFFSCESGVTAKDHRQITAKDRIRRKLPPHSGSFDVTGFREDTLSYPPDSVFTKPIRYSLDIQFRDSAGMLQSRTGEVIFAPDGKSVISSRIIEKTQ